MREDKLQSVLWCVHQIVSACRIRKPGRPDAGLLNDFGGGKVEWWWNYIRELLNASYDFHSLQYDELLDAKLTDTINEALRVSAQAIAGTSGALTDQPKIRILQAELRSAIEEVKQMPHILPCQIFPSCRSVGAKKVCDCRLSELKQRGHKIENRYKSMRLAKLRVRLAELEKKAEERHE